MAIGEARLTYYEKSTSSRRPGVDDLYRGRQGPRIAYTIFAMVDIFAVVSGLSAAPMPRRPGARHATAGECHGR